MPATIFPNYEIHSFSKFTNNQHLSLIKHHKIVVENLVRHKNGQLDGTPNNTSLCEWIKLCNRLADINGRLFNHGLTSGELNTLQHDFNAFVTDYNHSLPITINPLEPIDPPEENEPNLIDINSKPTAPKLKAFYDREYLLYIENLRQRTLELGSPIRSSWLWWVGAIILMTFAIGTLPIIVVPALSILTGLGLSNTGVIIIGGLIGGCTFLANFASADLAIPTTAIKFYYSLARLWTLLITEEGEEFEHNMTKKRMVGISLVKRFGIVTFFILPSLAILFSMGTVYATFILSGLLQLAFLSSLLGSALLPSAITIAIIATAIIFIKQAKSFSDLIFDTCKKFKDPNPVSTPALASETTTVTKPKSEKVEMENRIGNKYSDTHPEIKSKNEKSQSSGVADTNNSKKASKTFTAILWTLVVFAVFSAVILCLGTPSALLTVLGIPHLASYIISGLGLIAGTISLTVSKRRSLTSFQKISQLWFIQTIIYRLYKRCCSKSTNFIPWFFSRVFALLVTGLLLPIISVFYLTAVMVTLSLTGKSSFVFVFESWAENMYESSLLPLKERNALGYAKFLLRAIFYVPVGLISLLITGKWHPGGFVKEINCLLEGLSERCQGDYERHKKSTKLLGVIVATGRGLGYILAYMLIATTFVILHASKITLRMLRIPYLLFKRFFNALIKSGIVANAIFLSLPGLLTLAGIHTLGLTGITLIVIISGIIGIGQFISSLSGTESNTVWNRFFRTAKLEKNPYDEENFALIHRNSAVLGNNAQYIVQNDGWYYRVMKDVIETCLAKCNGCEEYDQALNLAVANGA